MALFTSCKDSYLPDAEPTPWAIICSCKKAPSWCWYLAKCCSVIPIFIIICCWRLMPISWIWVMPWATILKYSSKFWFLFSLLYFLLSFLKFFENLKISFFEASRENFRMSFTSSKEGLSKLILCFNFWIYKSTLYSWISSSCSWVLYSSSVL